MKRAGSLKRKKPLGGCAKFERLARASYRKAMPPAAKLRRARLKPVGSRASREKAALKAFRESVLARAMGYCERCGCKSSYPLDAHHVVGRGRAKGWPDLNNPHVNGLGVDRWCHEALTTDAMDLGGPCEAVARVAHAQFNAWRAGTRT